MKKIKYVILAVFIIAAFLIGLFYFYPGIPDVEKIRIEEEKSIHVNENLIVTEVLDGDEFLMSDGARVRLLGVDTPEKFDSDKLDRQVELRKRDRESIKKLGLVASDYVRNIVEGKNVKLVNDPNYYDVDEHKRRLRYVYLEDGTFLNEKILKDGYANVFYDKKISKNDEFFKIEQEAKKSKTGLWGVPDGLK